MSTISYVPSATSRRLEAVQPRRGLSAVLRRLVRRWFPRLTSKRSGVQQMSVGYRLMAMQARGRGDSAGAALYRACSRAVRGREEGLVR